MVFTRIDEEDNAGLGDGLGGVDISNRKDLNEGQKMVFELQDADKNNKLINENDIEAPMLLDGVSLDQDKFEVGSMTRKFSKLN